MNKQERKECQYSDYYRMTGKKWSFVRGGNNVAPL